MSSPESLNKIIDFLKADVRQHGGSAGETVNVHGHLMLIQVSCSPWGPIVIKKEVTRLEALADWFSAE